MSDGKSRGDLMPNAYCAIILSNYLAIHKSDQALVDSGLRKIGLFDEFKY